VHDSTQSCLYLCLLVQVHLFAVRKKPISLLMSICVVRPIPRLLLKLVLGERFAKWGLKMNVMHDLHVV
jgi:hypothetical protein